MAASKSNRDSVPRAQEKVLLQRSGNFCAYTDCTRELVAPANNSLDSDKPLGKIAHIYAASENGPRGSSEMTSKERGDATNLIYLCAEHHDIVDAHLAEHPPEKLLEMKTVHESAVRRAVRQLTETIAFEDLELICRVLGSVPLSEIEISIELSMDTKEKIDLNELGEESEDLIRAGLAQASRTEDFFAYQAKQDSVFERRLTARFKSYYHAAIASGLVGDDAFQYVLSEGMAHAKVLDTPRNQATNLAVVSYLFEICEIFEHE